MRSRTLALKELARLGLPTEGLTPKHWDVFATPDAAEMDFIFTVCDSAAGEIWSRWPGRPSALGYRGSSCSRRHECWKVAFSTAAHYPRNRIAAFLRLPLRSLNAFVDEARLRESG
jgi:arsenate reductase